MFWTWVRFPSTPQCFLIIRNTVIRRKFKFQPKKVEAPRYRVNEQIRLPRVFVIGENGEQIGEMSNVEALAMARENMLDLVEVSPNARPPVCRILDYGKFQYQQSKQKRLAQAKQKKVETKNIRIGLRTDKHDLDFKKGQIDKFLSKGNKVKVEIIIRGREKAHRDLARGSLLKFTALIGIPFKVEEEVKSFPGGFNILIAPQ